MNSKRLAPCLSKRRCCGCGSMEIGTFLGVRYRGVFFPTFSPDSNPLQADLKGANATQ